MKQLVLEMLKRIVGIVSRDEVIIGRGSLIVEGCSHSELRWIRIDLFDYDDRVDAGCCKLLLRLSTQLSMLVSYYTHIMKSFC